jgi:hypothetical protein
MTTSLKQYVALLLGTRRGDNAISQEELFSLQINLLLRYDQSPLYFFGYDAPFMERDPTVDSIRRSLEWKRGDPSDPTLISAIITESETPTVLEGLVKEFGPTKIRLVVTPDKIESGFTVFGMGGIGQWDSTKLTDYPPEHSMGVIYRTLISFSPSSAYAELAISKALEFSELEAGLFATGRYRLIQ